MMEQAVMQDLLVLNRELNRRLTDHMNMEEAHYMVQNKTIKKLVDEVEALSALIKAFPVLEDGVPDLAGHRAYHDEKIVDRRVSKKRMETIKETLLIDLAKAIAVAAVVLLGLGAQTWIQHNWYENAHVLQAEIHKDVHVNQQADK